MFSMALAACGVLEDTLLRMDLEEVSGYFSCEKYYYIVFLVDVGHFSAEP